jgi:hypothetical protein
MISAGHRPFLVIPFPHFCASLRSRLTVAVLGARFDREFPIAAADVGIFPGGCRLRKAPDCPWIRPQEGVIASNSALIAAPICVGLRNYVSKDEVCRLNRRIAARLRYSRKDVGQGGRQVA